MLKRHLRKVYMDPMTGKSNWGLVVQGDRILGVHSQSLDQPLKSANFDAADASFAAGNSYADWLFVYAPLDGQSAPATPVAPGAQQQR